MEKSGILYRMNSEDDLIRFLGFLRNNGMETSDIGGPENYAQYWLNFPGEPGSSIIETKTGKDYRFVVFNEDSEFDKLVQKYLNENS